MIVGYDFWGDGVYYDSSITPIVEIDNDGVSFDNCNLINDVNKFTLNNGEFDELHITKDNTEIDSNTQKTDWTINTVLLAKFNNDLVAGTIGVAGYNITKIELRKRKKGDEFWQTYFTIDYDDDINWYTIIDKFIESNEDYEYCLRPIATNEEGEEIYGDNTESRNIYISYDHAHIFDNSSSFDLIYDLKLGSITKEIGANTIETLGSQYPYVIYGQTNYLKGNLECLLVSEESATGNIDLQSEKILRNNIFEFLSNKDYKILKNSDGLYLLIQIVGNPTLTPSNDILGVYQLSFEYIEIGNVNNVDELSNLNFKFDYLKQKILNNSTVVESDTKVVG